MDSLYLSSVSSSRETWGLVHLEELKKCLPGYILNLRPSSIMRCVHFKSGECHTEHLEAVSVGA